MAIDAALAKVKETGDLPIPLHLRNAPTKLMKNLDYGKNYKYAHSYENNFVEQQYLPDKIVDTDFYSPGNNQKEESIKKFMSWLRKR
jgi:putative ATPase